MDWLSWSHGGPYCIEELFGEAVEWPSEGEITAHVDVEVDADGEVDQTLMQLVTYENTDQQAGTMSALDGDRSLPTRTNTSSDTNARKEFHVTTAGSRRG